MSVKKVDDGAKTEEEKSSMTTGELAKSEHPKAPAVPLESPKPPPEKEEEKEPEKETKKK